MISLDWTLGFSLSQALEALFLLLDVVFWQSSSISVSREATRKFSFWPRIFFFFPLTLLPPGVSSSNSLKDLGCLVSIATTYLIIPKMSFFLPAISPVFFLIHMKSILKHILSSISMTHHPFTHATYWCYQMTHLTLHEQLWPSDWQATWPLFFHALVKQ